MSELSENIRSMRKKAGLTQLDFAEKLGVSIATLRRWENGETAPTTTKVSEIANVLGTSPSEIVAKRTLYHLVKPEEPEKTAHNGAIVFENNGMRIELPETEKGYEVLNQLVENVLKNKNQKSDNNDKSSEGLGIRN
ncbi:MAG: helix-turn-helix transcriptional regulator [Synergistaceae bacterium]|nr:helix-turn-helix transcriptional regulator [Synergistaceae bacterium]